MKRGIVGIVILALTSVLLGVFALHPELVRADLGALGGVAGALYPIESSDIRLEAETVQALCYRSYAEFRIDFKFVNEGQPQTLQLGFPFLVKPPSTAGRFIGFRVTQDGARLAVSVGESASSLTTMATGPTPPVESYFLMKATFPRGETMFTVTYLAEPTWLGYGRLPTTTPPELAALGLEGQGAKYDYWLHTGAGWAGTISKAVVRFQLADDFDGWAVDVRASDPIVRSSKLRPYTTAPETYTRPDDRTYQWVFEDIEPTSTDDIVLAFTGGAFHLLPIQRATERSGPVPAKYGALVIPLTASGNLGYSSPPGDPAPLAPGWWAVEGSLTRSWGVPAPGKGAWIKLGVEGDQDLKEVRILPGRNDYEGAFGEHGRPKMVRVTLSDGTSAVVMLRDEASLQKFPVAGEAQWVRLDILDIYHGSKSDETYITEIGLGTERAPSFLSFAELIEREGIAQVSPTAQAPPTGPTAAPSAAPSEPVSAQAGSADGGFPGHVVWPLVGVLGVAGLALLASAGRRWRCRFKA